MKFTAPCEQVAAALPLEGAAFVLNQLWMLLVQFTRPGSWPGEKNKIKIFAEAPLFSQLPTTLIVQRMPPSYVPCIAYAHSATEKRKPRQCAECNPTNPFICRLIKLSKQTLQRSQNCPD